MGDWRGARGGALQHAHEHDHRVPGERGDALVPLQGVALTPEVWENTSSAGVSTLQAKYDANLDPYYSVQTSVAPYTTYTKAQLVACQAP